MTKNIKKMDILKVSSKIGICGLPIRCDTYSKCSFGCKYCFSQKRVLENPVEFKVGNINKLKKTLERIFDKGEIKENNFLDKLISERITWHCGGLCDPFMPCEEKYHITHDMIDLCNKYGISILFSTKSDNLYGADIRPDLHTFQLSVSNVQNNKEWEPNVPSIENRYKLFRELKDKGFKVGIRIQPFIPGVTTTEIIDLFKDADCFTLETLKIVPQNLELKANILKHIDMPKENYRLQGLDNMLPELKLEFYKPFIEKLESYNIPFNIADNDLRWIGKSKCCCGDALVKKSTTFNTTAMIMKYGRDYNLQNVYDELDCFCECKCADVFTSNRQKGVITLRDFMNRNYDSKLNPTGKSFQHFTNDAFYSGYVNSVSQQIPQ